MLVGFLTGVGIQVFWGSVPACSGVPVSGAALSGVVMVEVAGQVAMGVGLVEEQFGPVLEVAIASAPAAVARPGR